MANILIVEDEKAIQDIIADYMRKGGHTCFTADDGIVTLIRSSYKFEVAV